MRLYLPRLLRLIILLLAALSLITAGRLSTVQSSQPAPSCVIYTDGGKVGISPELLDPRTGQSSDGARDYFATYEYQFEKLEYSPTGRAFVMRVGTFVAERSWLFVGVPGSDKLRKVTEAYEIAGGWSPDGNSYAYIDNDHPERLTIIDIGGNQKRVLPLDTGAIRRPIRFAGWSGDSRYVAAMTLGKGRTAYYYFLSVDASEFLLKSIDAQYNPYTLESGLSWSPQGNRFAYFDTNKPAHLMIASPEHGIEQQVDIPASEDDAISLPIDWSPDGRYVMLNIGIADNAHETKNSMLDYWASTIIGIDGRVRRTIRGNNLRDAMYERPQGWWARDGSVWVFRQQSYASDNTGVDDRILRYQIDTDSYHTMVEHVAGNPLLSSGQWVAVPVWVEGSMNIALISKDGTAQYTIDQDFEAISDMRWLDQRLLFYIARREASYAVGVFDAEMGEALIQLKGLSEDVIVNPQSDGIAYHQLYLSYSAKSFVLKVGEPTKQSLYLISLVNKQSHHVLAEGYELSDVFWSEDDSTIAFIQYDRAEKRAVLHILSADGSTAQQFSPSGDEYPVLLGWTWCP